jgi:hypothetical protein
MFPSFPHLAPMLAPVAPPFHPRSSTVPTRSEHPPVPRRSLAVHPQASPCSLTISAPASGTMDGTTVHFCSSLGHLGPECFRAGVNLPGSVALSVFPTAFLLHVRRRRSCPGNGAARSCAHPSDGAKCSHQLRTEANARGRLGNLAISRMELMYVPDRTIVLGHDGAFSSNRMAEVIYHPPPPVELKDAAVDART